MPKSDTWPGGVALETSGMDSAGSCDSVVSANSGSSDDSLEHLSAEEKACLMFLEETIESLDTEEDSGLSNDEPDHTTKPGNLATKAADLSESIRKSNVTNSQKLGSKEPMKEHVHTKYVQNLMVPTPIVVAQTQAGVSPPMKVNRSSHKHNQKPSRVRFEDDMTTPATKDVSFRTVENPLPRGPLSHEALVYMQRTASTKKTPLCPKVDHTIEWDKSSPGTAEGLKTRKLAGSERSDSESSKSRKSPPAVAPKPKTIPANLHVETQNSTSLSSSQSFRHATDPQAVRQEALKKLGLLKEKPSPNEVGASPQSHSSGEPTCEQTIKGHAARYPPRSPSFSYSPAPTEARSRPLQSSASFHHFSRQDQCSAPTSGSTQTSGSSTVVPGQTVRVNSPKTNGKCPGLGNIPETEPKETPVPQPDPHKPPNSVEYSVVVVPGMGADRREALRKLGLLKY